MPSHPQPFHPNLGGLFLPPLSLTPVTQQLPPLPSQQQHHHQHQHQHHHHQYSQQFKMQRRPTITHQRLSRANVAAIDSKDSRQARWHRVLSFVAQVRHSYAASHSTSSSPSNSYTNNTTNTVANDGSESPTTSSWIFDQERIISTPPDEDVIDPLMSSLWATQPMKIRRSLWDGGSCGTDGVDQFVWDDELDSGGNRFTLPPRSQQGDYVKPVSRENSPMLFSFEGPPTASSSESRRRAMEVDDNQHEEQRPSKRQRSTDSLKYSSTDGNSNNNKNNSSSQIRVSNANISKTHALALEQYLETLKAIEKSRLPMMNKTVNYDYGFGGGDRWRQVYGVA